LLEIYVLIDRENPVAAETLYTAFEEKADLLAQYRRLGPRHPDISPSTRTVIEGAYLLLYEIYPNGDEGPIKVVRVVAI
jgi:plasmid stabilization system protein ParE